MSRKKRDIIILTVLFPVLFFILFGGWHKKGKPLDIIETEEIAAPPVASTLNSELSGKKMKEIENEQIALEKSYIENGFPRNPFMKLEEETKGKTKSIKISLSGVFFSDENGTMPHALINGRILSKGDAFFGVAVEEIGAEFVVLRSGDDTYKVKVGVPLTIPVN